VNIHHHVELWRSQHPDQFDLLVFGLIMLHAQYAFDVSIVVVLLKLVIGTLIASLKACRSKLS
jgi:hypothetical protein